MKPERPTAEVVDLADLDADEARLTAEIREEIVRDRSTAQALRDYLHASSRQP